MSPPEMDLMGRRPVWDVLQMFWMDTDPELFLEYASRICAASSYSLEEIAQIYWNEVRPAVKINLMSVAGEWKGFELEWLSDRILEVNRFGSPLPRTWSDPDAAGWWEKLRGEIERLRR